MTQILSAGAGFSYIALSGPNECCVYAQALRSIRRKPIENANQSLVLRIFPPFDVVFA
jgi:hypothetical protein